MKHFRQCVQKGKQSKTYADAVRGEVKLDLSINTFARKIVDERVLKLSAADIVEYPDPTELPVLKELVARQEAVTPEEVMFTTGADRAIEIVLTRILSAGERVAINIPTFPFFEVVARSVCDARTLFFEALDRIPSAKMVVLCSPNNPTTQELSEETVRRILEENPDTMIVLDAVFADFGTWNPSRLVEEFSNLVVLRSFSKVGFAGLRLGSIVSQQENIEYFKVGVSPFRVPVVTQRIALNVLQETTVLETGKRLLNKEFAFIRGELPQAVRETNLPFFLLPTEQDSTVVREKLLGKGVSVVDGKNFRGLGDNFLRVMIGTREENKQFIQAFKQVAAQGGS